MFHVVKLAMSSSDEENEFQHLSSEMQFIAQEVKSFPIILQKSQLPKLKKMKDEAIENVLAKYKLVFGKEIDSRSFMKKVNNMKTRMKKKTDFKKTGNTKINLVEWERVMFSAINGTSNHTKNKIPGKLYFIYIFETFLNIYHVVVIW